MVDFPGLFRGFVVAIGLYAQSAGATGSVHVTVVNKAEVPEEVVRAAERIAASIFSAAGIQTEWEECGAAARPAAGGPLEILVIINVDANPRVGRDALGIALPSVGEGNRAGVFYSRIQAAARETTVSLGASVTEILAHAMAHEIGHLLLNWVTHAQRGLMRGAWSVVEFDAMRSSRLSFSAGEAAVMRRRIEKAMRQGERD